MLDLSIQKEHVGGYQINLLRPEYVGWIPAFAGMTGESKYDWDNLSFSVTPVKTGVHQANVL
ncbi:MAG: hypothetical protein ACE5FH_04230 [Candidatus Zixiibacteriota bacterium]